MIRTMHWAAQTTEAISEDGCSAGFMKRSILEARLWPLVRRNRTWGAVQHVPERGFSFVRSVLCRQHYLSGLAASRLQISDMHDLRWPVPAREHLAGRQEGRDPRCYVRHAILASVLSVPKTTFYV